MTDEELRAIEERADAATWGPWRAGHVEAEGKVWARDAHALGGHHLGEVCIFNANLHRPHTPDREFVAHARTDVPALIAEVRRLRAEAMRHVIGLGIVALAVSAESHEPEAIIKAINDAVERARTAPSLP